MKTIQIDGKHYIKSKIVMLPTENKTNLAKDFLDNFWFNRVFESDLKRSNAAVYQHLYLLLDEDIEEGDWYIHPFLGLIKNKDKINEIFPKVIATTNPELKRKVVGEDYRMQWVSAISNEFLQQYVKNPVEEVLVEVIDNGYEVDMEGIGGEDVGWFAKWEIKTSPENNVSIRFIEEDWNSLGQKYKEWEGSNKEEKVHWTTFVKFLRVQGYNVPTKK